MNKKSSLSLSTNAIVVIILAIVMLSLALGFIGTMFRKTSAQVEAIVANEPNPRSAGPGEQLTLSRNTIVLSASEKTALKFSVYKGGSVSDPDLIGYWSFDEVTGQTVSDYSSYNNAGTLGADSAVAGDDPAPQSGVNCKAGNCLEFDGGDIVTVPNDPAVISPASITLLAWAKPDTILGGRDNIVGKVNGANREYELQNNAGVIEGQIYFVGASLVPIIASGFSVGVWTHVALTFDDDDSSNMATVYKDGTPIGPNAIKGPQPANRQNNQPTPLLFGNIYSGTEFWDGTIDEILMYKRALTAQEVKNIANGNLIRVNKGCIADSSTDNTHPLKILSQVAKPVENGQAVQSELVLQADTTSGVDAVCQICAEPYAGGGCVDVRLIIK